MKYCISVFLIILAFAACKEPEDSNSSSTDVSNFQVQIDILDGSTGFVSITASADNALLFEYDFGDGSISSTPNGYIEYNYASGGFYEVSVKAIGAGDRFLKYTENIVVDFGDPDNLLPGYTTPLSYDGMDLVWADEFTGNTLNSSIWKHEIGDGCPNLCGWGNNELEYYRAQNTTLANGVVTVEARQENFGGRNYTSSRIKTQGNYAFKYGRVDIRAKMPRGKGMWPALWMLGSNITSEGWPSCGEVDIMEMIGGKESITYGTAHWDFQGTYASDGDNYDNQVGIDDEFHVFSIDWDPNRIIWYFDDKEYYTLSITDPEMSEFHQSFFFILNVAVGGNWPGSPDATTEFPAQMQVDYVRVFQDQ